MVFGRKVLLPMAVVISTPEEDTSSQEYTYSYVQSLKSKIKSAHNIPRNNLKKPQYTEKGIMT
ncbi:hypothetical protein DPMN_111522 [Dreissena polymorpha]|uniref:Uncharacterized protein n=1 Tax=Dreissena polymorpha TaxID=45954 RepID=A0A9D4KEF4_DREPO|nr:hypothetical protein DPMN_111522 [Dreissena polymorpha]